MASATPHIDAFLAAADYFVGVTENPMGSNRFTSAKGREMVSLAGFGQGFAWCALFVSACAEKAGIADIVILKDTGAGGVTGGSVDYLGATWIPGPYFTGCAVTPQRGDLFTIIGSSSYYTGYNHAGHIGIVEYVDDDGVHTIEGNSGDQCRRLIRPIDSGSINGYCRPNWAYLGDNVSGGAVGPLYKIRNDRHDMTMRQVGYIDTNYKLSNKSSNIALSVINYTSVLGDLWDMFAPALTTKVTVDTSQLSGNTKISVDYFISKKFSASASCAITGCLLTYSALNPSCYIPYTATNSYSYGIAAWDSIRLKSIKERVGNDWSHNLSGQLQYLYDDLNSRFPQLVALIQNKTLSNESATQAAALFITTYNPRYTSQYYVDKAKKYASEIYDKLIITKTSIIGNVANLKDINGNQLSSQYSVTIPTSIPQTGIIDDYTSYSAWYSRWHRSSPQKKLAMLWGDQGFPSSKGIAMIGGYYCVAVRPKFGKCGEVIVVTLEDNTSFAAIICDEKGEDAGSEWGHVKGGGNISLIEWQRVKTEYGQVVTGTGFSDVDSRGFDDWYRKKVVSITNYGKYVSVGWS